jgi:pyruvate dehydrogenase E2 component (dihydrolipoamide acetyltransferase)
MCSLPEYEKVPLPALSPTMESGTIVQWNVKEGEAFGAGVVLCEVETDKAAVDFESTEDGILAKILVPEGVETTVGATIAITVENEEDVAAFANYEDDEATSAPPAASPEPATSPAAAASPGMPPPPPATPPVASPVAPPAAAAAPAAATSAGNVGGFDGRWRAQVSASALGAKMKADQEAYAEEFGFDGSDPLP